MKQRMNHQEDDIPEIVLQYERMVADGQIGFLEQQDFETIIEFYEEKNKFDHASALVDLAIDRYPFQSGFLLSKASLLLAIGQLKEAEEIIDRAYLIAPSEWEVKFRKAELAAMNRKFDVALSTIDEIIDQQKEADFGMLYLLKGMIYQEITDFRKMYDSLKLSLEADHTNEQALHLFWLSVEICQEHEESIEFHQWLIDQEPYSALAWSNLGHAYSCLEKWAKAAEAFEYAYIIDKEFEFAYRDCAIALIHLKEYQKALDAINEGLQYFTADREVLEQIGNCHIELGNFEEARIALLDGLSLDAQSNQLHYHLGRLHNREGNFQKALIYLKRALQFEQPKPEYYLELARVSDTLADMIQADHYYEEACMLAPDNLDFHLEYAEFKGKKFGEDYAMRFLKSLRDIFPDAAINYCAIGIMLNLESRKKGLDKLANALNKNYKQHTTLLKYFPKLRQDKEVNAIIASYKPMA